MGACVYLCDSQWFIGSAVVNEKRVTVTSIGSSFLDTTLSSQQL